MNKKPYDYDTDLLTFAKAIGGSRGGGGSSTSILSGTDEPTSDVGDDGAIYLKVGFDGDDSGLGWGANKNTICDFTTTMGTVNGRDYYKSTNEPALVAFPFSGYIQPLTASTIPTACAYRADSGGPWSYDHSYEIEGVTWYFFSGMHGFYNGSLSSNFPQLSENVNLATQSGAERMLELLGVTFNVSQDKIVQAYIKVNGVWQYLIGSNLSDIILTM